MNVRNFIAILVCLGMVAFASTAFSTLNIKHNLDAVVVEAGGSTSNLNKSMQRLSSGLRINSAKDDASGLGTSDIISETFVYIDGGEGGVERVGGFQYDSGGDDRFIDAETVEDETYILIESYSPDEDRWTPGLIRAGTEGGIADEIHFPLEGYSGIRIADMAVGIDFVYLWGSAQLDVARLNRDLFLIIHDPHDGYEIRTFSSGGGDDEAEAIELDTDGNVYTVSAYNKGDAGIDIDVIMHDAHGTEIWKKTIDDGLIDSFGGIKYDPASNKILLATNSLSGTLKWIPQFKRLNKSDGSTDYEQTGDYENDRTVEIMELTPIGDHLLSVQNETDVAGSTRSVVEVRNSLTFEVEAELTDVPNSYYFALKAYNTSDEEDDYSDEIMGAVTGERPDGSAFKAVITTEPALHPIEREQPPDYDLILYGDKLVFLEYGPDVGSLSLVGFEITEGYEAAVPAGTNVTATISELGVSAEFEVVDTSGLLYAEANPEGSLVLPTYFELEGRDITRITTDATFSGDVQLTLTYDESQVEDESNLIVLKSDPDALEPIWIPPGIIEGDPESNTIIVIIPPGIIPQFSDFAVGSYTDLAGAIQNLIYVIEGWNLEGGWVNSLDAKLQKLMDALSAANAGNRADAINRVDAFMNEVEAQKGNKLTEAQADRLIAEATAIKVNL